MAETKVTNTELSLPQSVGTSGYVVVGSILFQWGNVTCTNAGTSITFPRAFSATPNVQCNVNDVGNQYATVYSASSTGATFRQSYTGGTLPVLWFAVGPA